MQFHLVSKKFQNTGKELITENIQDFKSIEGVVKSIEFEKNGYTAKLESFDKQIYFLTISHTNLKNSKKYKTSNIGDTIKVSGEFWKMGEENQITVQKID